MEPHGEDDPHGTKHSQNHNTNMQDHSHVDPRAKSYPTTNVVNLHITLFKIHNNVQWDQLVEYRIFIYSG